MSTAKAPRRFPARACTPRSGSTRERTHGRAAAAPGPSRQVAMALSTSSAPAGHSRRNAVGRDGVKLGAAPDAPHWGEVLIRSLSGRFSSARWGATSKFTCLSRDYQGCRALYRNPGRTEPRPRWPASSGGGRRRGQTTSIQPRAGLRIARYPAWALCKAEMAAQAARRTRQRASADRTCGGDPHPGKDPL
jgi:hypothetical protein